MKLDSNAKACLASIMDPRAFVVASALAYSIYISDSQSYLRHVVMLGDIPHAVELSRTAHSIFDVVEVTIAVVCFIGFIASYASYRKSVSG